MLERNNLGKKEPKLVHVLRNSIYVEQNGKIVKYIRSPNKKKNPKPKNNVPKRKNNAAAKNQMVTNAANVMVKDCRVILVNMTAEDIARATEQDGTKKNRNKKHPIVNPMDSMWPKVSFQRHEIMVKVALNNLRKIDQRSSNVNIFGLSHVNRNDTIKIVIGNDTFLIEGTMFRSLMSQLGLIKLVPNYDTTIVNRIEQQSTDMNRIVDDLANMFAKMSLIDQNQVALADQQPKTVDDSLQWIEHGDTVKITVGRNTFYFSFAAFCSVISQRGFIASNMMCIDSNNQIAQVKLIISINLM